jgi:GNAT superfamily N-acetyltransferase
MVVFPAGFVLEPLRKSHPRSGFGSGHPAVDRWLKEQALQSQEKKLTATRVLAAPTGELAGFFSLAVSQVDFGELPEAVVKRLPRRALPVAVLAWLGVDRRHQRAKLGARLLAQALVECHLAGKTFPFVAVLLDCVDENAKRFYQRWSFRELPGRPMRLFLSAAELDAMS